MNTVGNTRIYKQCTDASVGFAETLMEQFQQAMTEKLQGLVETTRSGAQQWQLLDILQLMGNKDQRTLGEFKQNLLLSFQRFAKGEISVDDSFNPTQTDTLSLVQNDDLELGLATGSLVKRIEDKFPEELFLVHERLQALVGHTLPAEANPVGPTQLAGGFKETIAVLQLEPKVAILFFKIFEKTLLLNAAGLYQSLNEILAGAGVLPELDFAQAQREKRKQQRPASNTANMQVLDQELQQAEQELGVHTQPEVHQDYPAQTMAQPNPGLPSGAYQQQLFSAISTMQQQSQPPQQPQDMGGEYLPAATQQGIAGQGFPGSGVMGQDVSSQSTNASGEYTQAVPGMPLPRQDLVVALGQVQQHAVAGTAAGVVTTSVAKNLNRLADVAPGRVLPCPIQPVTILVNAIEEQTGISDQQLNEDDINTMELVSMVFEFLIGDNNLPDSVKALLSYLQVPYVKIALIDPEYFAQPVHPARQLLNKLSDAGDRWLNDEGFGQFKVFDEIKDVVDRILNTEELSLEMFDVLLDDFVQYVEKIERKVDQLEKLSAQKAEAEQHLKKVKAFVHKRLKARVKDENIPAPVVALLLYPWFDYLTSIMLRHTEKSEQWQQSLQVVDNLLWSIQIKRTEHEVNRLNNLKDLLHKQIERGLETIGYDHEKGQALLNKINELQQQAVQVIREEDMISDEDVVEVEKMKAETAQREELITAPDFRDMSKEEQALVEKLSLIEFGTWFEFLEEDRAEKLKVAWYNNENLSYLFVNSAGKQVSMLSALDIAQKMITKSARIIAGSTKPFFERALEGIFEKMAARVEQ